MSTSKRLFKNTLALSIASAGQLVGNVILFFFLSRLLQAEGLGIYSTVLAIFSTVSLGCGIGLNSFLTRELPKDYSKTNVYLIHAGIVTATTGIIFMIGLDLLLPYLGYLPQTRAGLYIISTALIPESLQVVLFATFVAHQKAEFITATSVFAILGRISVSLLTLYLGYGVISLIVIYVIFSYLSLLMNLVFLIRSIQVPYWEFDKLFLFKMLHELKVFAALALLVALCSQSEVIILSLTRGETQVGYYSAALKLVTIWAMIPSSYMMALFPVLSMTFQESQEKFIEIQNKSLKYLLALGFPLALGMTVTAGAIIPQFYGPGFQESVVTLRILSWYLPLIFINNMLWRILFVRDKQQVVFKWQLITEILQALLAVWLTPKFGCLGAAWAVLGGNLAYSAGFVYYLWRVKSPIPLVRNGWRFLLASMVMGIFTWFCVSRIQIFVLIPAAAAVYLAIIWIFRAFSSDDIALFRQVLRVSRKVSIAEQEVLLIDPSK